MKIDTIASHVLALAVSVIAMAGIHTAHAAKPAFKCKNLKSSIEQMICKDDKLAELDQKVTQYYKSVLKAVSNDQIKTIKAEQRGWYKGRNDCWKADDKRQCVVDNYNYRITDLQIQSGSIMVPEASGFDCGNQQILTAYFYNNTLLPAAVLNFGEEQINAYQAPAASGAKYDGRNVSIWSKGDEAALTWHGKEFKCKEVPSSNL